MVRRLAWIEKSDISTLRVERLSLSRLRTPSSGWVMSSASPSRMECSTYSGQSICCNGSPSGGKLSRSSNVLRARVDASSAATSISFVLSIILRTISYRPNSKRGSPLPNRSLDSTATLAESCRTCSRPQASSTCTQISYQIGPSAALVETQSAAGTGRFSSTAPCLSPPKYSAVRISHATSPGAQSSVSATPRSMSTAHYFTSKVVSLQHGYRSNGSGDGEHFSRAKSPRRSCNVCHLAFTWPEVSIAIGIYRSEGSSSGLQNADPARVDVRDQGGSISRGQRQARRYSYQRYSVAL